MVFRRIRLFALEVLSSSQTAHEERDARSADAHRICSPASRLSVDAGNSCPLAVTANARACFGCCSKFRTLHIQLLRILSTFAFVSLRPSDAATLSCAPRHAGDWLFAAEKPLTSGRRWVRPLQRPRAARVRGHQPRTKNLICSCNRKWVSTPASCPPVSAFKSRMP